MKIIKVWGTGVRVGGYREKPPLVIVG